MRVSVVVATHNRAELLARALKALALQTHPSDAFEVVVVADGCSDGTEDLVRTFQQRAPMPVLLLSQRNAGPSRARNAGIAAATGEVVLFMDDDLEPAPEFVAAHAQWHARHSHAAVIGRSVQDPARRRSEPMWVAWDHAMLEKQYRGWREGTRKPPGPHNFYTGNASVRRADALAIGGFDVEMRRQEDVDLACRLARAFPTAFIFEPAAVGYHRPQRGFRGWQEIPCSYGSLDVARAQRGDAPWDRVRDAYRTRTGITRILAATTLRAPWTGPVVRGGLIAMARCADAVGARGTALRTLSAFYNVRYLEGVAAALGGGNAVRRLLQGEDPAPLPLPASGDGVPGSAGPAGCKAPAAPR